MTWFTWLLIIIVIILLIWFLWRWYSLRKNTSAAASRPQQPAVKASPPVVQTVAPVPSAPTPPKSDDLALIEGIGPKIASILQTAGITTFAQLAASDTGRLSAILKAAGLPFSDPTSWPEQAGLAASGKMDELKVLQDNLKGGRRT